MYKMVNKNYGKLPDNLSKEKPWDKLFVDIKGPYKIRRKGKEPITLEALTRIDPVTMWFKVIQYSNNKSMMIENLVETMGLVQYLWSVYITYNQGGEFPGHEF